MASLYILFAKNVFATFLFICIKILEMSHSICQVGVLITEHLFVLVGFADAAVDPIDFPISPAFAIPKVNLLNS